LTLGTGLTRISSYLASKIGRLTSCSDFATIVSRQNRTLDDPLEATMQKRVIKLKKYKRCLGLLSVAFKKRMPDDDDTVPILFKRDLYRDKPLNAATH
jgi:hypothetical protein